MPKYTDETPMPFGKHEGTPLKDVPADYLMWVADQNWLEEWPSLEEYLTDNEQSIQMELRYE